MGGAEVVPQLVREGHVAGGATGVGDAHRVRGERRADALHLPGEAAVGPTGLGGDECDEVGAVLVAQHVQLVVHPVAGVGQLVERGAVDRTVDRDLGAVRQPQDGVDAGGVERLVGLLDHQGDVGIHAGLPAVVRLGGRRVGDEDVDDRSVGGGRGDLRNVARGVIRRVAGGVAGGGRRRNVVAVLRGARRLRVLGLGRRLVAVLRRARSVDVVLARGHGRGEPTVGRRRGVRVGGRELRLVHLLDPGASVGERAQPVGRVLARHQTGEHAVLLDEDDGAALVAGDRAAPRSIAALRADLRSTQVGDDRGVVEQRQLDVLRRRLGGVSREHRGVHGDRAGAGDAAVTAVDLIGGGGGVDDRGTHGSGVARLDASRGTGQGVGAGSGRGGFRSRGRRHDHRRDGDGDGRQRKTAMTTRGRRTHRAP